MSVSGFEERESLRQLAGFVATFMSTAHGDPWHVDGSQHRVASNGVYLIQPRTGAEVSVQYTEKSNGRVEFKAKYPDGTRKRVFPEPIQFSCTVDRYKDVDRIANDVLRKVVGPEYFAELKRCRESLDADQNNIRVRREIGDKLAAVYYPEKATVNAGNPGEKGTVDWSWNFHPRPAVVINHDGTKVSLRVEELTADEVAELLHVLSGMKHVRPSTF